MVGWWLQIQKWWSACAGNTILYYIILYYILLYYILYIYYIILYYIILYIILYDILLYYILYIYIIYICYIHYSWGNNLGHIIVFLKRLSVVSPWQSWCSGLRKQGNRSVILQGVQVVSTPGTDRPWSTGLPVNNCTIIQIIHIKNRYHENHV